MGTGAVISIDYTNAFGVIGAFSSGGNDIFSGILEPIRKAKTSGNNIMSKLRDISSRIDIDSTISKLYSQDDGERSLENEISEDAKSASNEEQVVYGALTNVESKLCEFGSTVISVDNKAAILIKERKLEFNRRYPHLESESEYRQRMDERSFREKVGDFCYGFVHGYGLIGGIDSLINGRERFDAHKEAIKQKIVEFATKTWEWVKENIEAIAAAVLVVVAALWAIATFGAGTVFLVASIAAFAYAVADKIVAINNNGKGIVQYLEANGHHHFAQICKGLNWGLQITMVISGFKMSGAGAEELFKIGPSGLRNRATSLVKGYSLFKNKGGFLATVGNGIVIGGGYNLVVDTMAYGINFCVSDDAKRNKAEYFKTATKDTAIDTLIGGGIGGSISGLSYGVVKLKDTFKFNSIKNSGIAKKAQGKELNHYVDQRAGKLYGDYAASEQWYTHDSSCIKGKTKGSYGIMDLVTNENGNIRLYETKLTPKAPHTGYQLAGGVDKGVMSRDIFFKDVPSTAKWLQSVSLPKGTPVTHIYGNNMTSVLGTRKLGLEATHYISNLTRVEFIDK